MFLDEAKINIKAGDGGDGLVSFHNLKNKRKKIASGGNGGKGGDVIIKATNRLSTLFHFQKKIHFKAESGRNGEPNNRTGSNGKDLVIDVPVGTIIRDLKGTVIADLDKEGSQILLAKGGRGGRGNAAFTSQARRFPSFAEKGERVDERWIKLELRLLADIGLVGFPNAGKSTLISKITAARPKIAEYPFTTLVPNLGVVALDGQSFTIADIPGLIEGAHKGTGLGDKFLRHVMRTALLIFMLDCQKILYGTDLADNFDVLKKELKNYNRRLAQKDYVVAVNKVDLISDEDVLNNLEKELEKRTDKKIFFISCVTGYGISNLVDYMGKKVLKAKEKAESKAAPGKKVVYDVKTTGAADDRIIIQKRGQDYIVKNKKLEKMVQMTDLENEEALNYLMHRFRKMHVGDRIKKLGVKEGSNVIIGNLVFELKE